MDFWGVANALKDAVKQQTAEIASSLQSTDWKSELSTLQEGIKEETVEITQKAKEVTGELGQKTYDAAKNLPQVVDQGRRKAVAQLENLPTTSAARAKEAAAQFQQAGVSLSKMGHSAVVNTSKMLDQLTFAIQAEMVAAQDGNTTRPVSAGGTAARPLGGDSSSKFSRFDADVAAMQRDSSTYCDEPDDSEEYEVWAAACDLSSKKPDIVKLLGENTFMSELQARIVPVIVDYDSFWKRYFYRLQKLEERHAKVAALTSGAAEPDVGWGTDEDDDVADDDAEEVLEGEEDEDSAVEQDDTEEIIEEEVIEEEEEEVVEQQEEQEIVVEEKIVEEEVETPEIVPEGEEEEVAKKIETAKVAVEEKKPAVAAAVAAVVVDLTAEKKDDDGDADDDDAASSLGFSAVGDDEDEEGGDGGEGDGNDSDWGDVAEWE